uniref:Integrase, catalytic region, zinc finger, CCHC-type, peptidase aspartic, catalytic n=1 Tax=Tanacetum cinerariifolium TaxID=118510 RepID=A0A6L2MVU5_TANCI|nr:hypothetical protein [Tanacetum cinerariifolium]
MEGLRSRHFKEDRLRGMQVVVLEVMLQLHGLIELGELLQHIRLRVILDEEHMEFLVDNGDTVTTGQASQEIPTLTVFQTDDLDTFDSDYDDAPSASAVLMAKISSYDSEEIASFENQIHLLKLQLNATVKSHKTLSTTVYVLKKESKAKENKYLEEIIDLEKKNKALDNVVYKMGQSTQTILVKDSLKQMKSHVIDFDNVVIVRTKVTSQNEGSWGFEHIRKAFEKDVKPFVHTLKEYFQIFDKGLIKEVTDMNEVFNQIETEVAIFFVEWKTFEIKEKELLIDNGRLLELIISQDLVHTAMNNLDAIADYQKMEQNYVDEYNECLELKAELSERMTWLTRLFIMNFLKDELLVYVSDTFPSSNKPSEKQIAVTPINKNKKVRFTEPSTSLSNTQKHVDSCKTKDSNKPLLPSKGVISSTSSSGSKPLGNTKKNRIAQPTSSNKKNKVEDLLRSVKSSLTKMNHVSEPVCNANVKHHVLNANSELIFATCNECMFDAIHDLCIPDYLNDVNVRAKPHSIKRKKEESVETYGDLMLLLFHRLPVSILGPSNHPLVPGLGLLYAHDQIALSAHQIPEHQLMTPRTISSGLMQNHASLKPYVPPTKNDWDMLFQSMFDKYFNHPPSVVPPVPPPAV